MTDVALYLPSLLGGGAERVTVTLANGFAERGLKVDLVLATAVGPYLKDVAPEVRIVDLKSKRVLTSLPGLIRYLRAERPRALLSSLNHANVIAIIATILAKVAVKLVVVEHNNLSASIKGRQSLRVMAVIRLMRWTYKKVDRVVAVSSGVADDLALVIGYSREKISVIYNPIVTLNLTELSKKSLNNTWFGKEKSPVILGVGRLTPQKSFKTLILAFAKVKIKIDCRLVILGEGELRKELEKLISDMKITESVLLPGFSDNPYAWMTHSAVFVMSSAWEGFPTVLVEAMACGTPVISTACPSGPDEILESGRWGALVPVDDTDGLANAIYEALAGKNNEGAYERAFRFDVKNAVDGYTDILFSD